LKERNFDGSHKELMLMKAREYDKIDLLRKLADFETKVVHYSTENNTLLRDKDKLEV
jgi:hypothetical protein